MNKRIYDPITDTDCDMIVSASAGSGKTFTMVSRIINIILSGKAKVSEILAVTFTNQAADEMKERLKKAITEKINEGRTELMEELLSIPSASICTIDSFCANLVRSWFFICGAEPDFGIMDENEAKLLKNKVINGIFEEKYQNKDADFYKLLSCFKKGRKDDNLINIVLDLANKISTEPNKEELLNICIKAYTPEGFEGTLKSLDMQLNDEINSALNVLSGIYADALKIGHKKLVEVAANYENYLKSLLKLDIYAKRGVVAVNTSKPTTGKKQPIEFEEVAQRYGALKNSLKKKTEDAFSVLSDYSTDRENYLNCREISVLLKNLVLEFISLYSEAKSEKNLLDFADIELKAYEIVSDENTRKNIAEKYKYILIDEYQDVNGLQEGIFSALGRNNTFTVGDIKQSIYGFRGCCSDFFADKVAAYENSEDKAVVRLNVNYRSCEEVLNYCNGVFKPLMANSKTKYEDLIYSGRYVDFHGECKYIHITDLTAKEKEKGIYSVRRAYENKTAEADSLTGVAIAKIIEKNLGRKFYDIKSGRERRLAYGDFAILMRGLGKSVPIIDTLLKDGIPVRCDNSTDIRIYPEIKQLTAILKLLVCFNDDISLATALKTLGGFTEDELLSIRRESKIDRNRPFADCYNACLDTSECSVYVKLNKFASFMEKLRFYSGILSVSDILNMIIKENNLDIKWGSMKLGEEKLKRVTRFIREASDYGNDIYTFLQRLEKGEDINFSSGLGDDCVTLTTIHKSKGLEYPFVIVCSLETRFNTDDYTKKDVFFGRKHGFAVKCYDEKEKVIRTNLYRTLLQREERKKLIDEELRLFYVALTRARAFLYCISASKEVSDKSSPDMLYDSKCMADFLSRENNIVEVTSADLESSLNGRAETREVFIGKADEKLTEKIQRNLGYLYPYARDILLPEKSTVTAVSENFDEEESVNIDNLFRYEDDEETDKAMRGTAYHKFLELYDFKEGRLIGEIDAELASFIKEEKIKEILKLPFIKDLFDFDCYKEKKFFVNVPAAQLFGDYSGKENVLIQGMIDLLAIKDGVARIYDYKFSAVNDELLITRYKGQLRLYKYAVEKILHIPVEKTILVNILACKELDVVTEK